MARGILLSLLGGALWTHAQVTHFQISSIPTNQYVSLAFPITITARDAGGNVTPFNGDVSLSGVLNGTPDYTYAFEEGNITQWTRLNPTSSYAVSTFDVTGAGQASLALDMRLNTGLVYGISRQLSLLGGVPYRFAIDTALATEQTVAYGTTPVRWSLRVGTQAVAQFQIDLGTISPPDVMRVGLAGGYVPPSNGLYAVSFVFECPAAETNFHVYGDNFRIGFAGLTPATARLVNGQATVNVVAAQAVTNFVLRVADTGSHTGNSNPFNILPTANLNLFTFLPQPPRVGEDIVIQNLVFNYGPSDATGVVLTNVLPPGLTLTSITTSRGTCTNVGNVISCNFGALTNSSPAVEVLIKARTSTPGNYTNVAFIGGNELDPESESTSSSRTTLIAVAQPLIESTATNVNESAGPMRFTLRLRAASTLPFTVNYATSNLTASAGADYTSVTGQVLFAAGDTNEEVQVPILNDTLDENAETFELHFFHATQAGIVVGTINDNDPQPSVSVTDLSAAEGAAGTNNFALALQLSALSGRPVSVNFVTSNGTAVAGSDYLSQTGTVIFPAGVTNASIVVGVLGDIVTELNETFYVALTQTTNATISRTQAVVTILNDDVASGALDHFTWSSIPSPQAAGRPFLVQVTARDASNNLVTSFGGTVPLTVLRRSGNVTNTIPPALAMSFTNGSGAINVLVTNAYTNVFCRVDDGTRRADSNPFEVLFPPRLFVPRVTGTNVHLQFTSTSNRFYRLEAVTNVTNTVWATVASNLLGSGTNVTVVHTNGAQAAGRFYRVALQP